VQLHSRGGLASNQGASVRKIGKSVKMTLEELAIEEAAIAFAKAQRASIARKIANTDIFIPEKSPITVFMAGSPGAGKTEVSKAMVEAFESGDLGFARQRVLRIDPDEFRSLLPGYTGCNSYLFQRAVTKILEKVLDRAFEKRLSFILDGTMANIEVAKRNIDRVLRYGGVAQIMYVYQRPELAWDFVKAREITEGRNIPMDEFVRQYLAVRRNIAELRRCYDVNVYVDLLIKNTDGSDESYEEGVSAEQIDAMLPETYDQVELIKLLTEVDRNDCS